MRIHPGMFTITNPTDILSSFVCVCLCVCLCVLLDASSASSLVPFHSSSVRTPYSRHKPCHIKIHRHSPFPATLLTPKLSLSHSLSLFAENPPLLSIRLFYSVCVCVWSVLSSLMKFPLHITSHGVDVNSDKRVCHACHTTTTSQWRYGRTDNVLLCNACGIRWKRKNKASMQEKIKPGPKRSRSQATTVDNSDSSSRSYPSSSTSARPYKSKRASMEEMVSATQMQSHYKTDSSERSHRRHNNGRSHQRSKMDITQLMSPVEEEYRPRSKTVIPRGSPISIQNLLNMPDDRKSSRRSCSSAIGLLPRYD